MAFTFEKIILPLTFVLIVWLFFEIIDFFRLGGASQPLAWCIVKISVITSTTIGLASGLNENNSVNLEQLLYKIKTLPMETKSGDK